MDNATHYLSEQGSCTYELRELAGKISEIEQGFLLIRISESHLEEIFFYVMLSLSKHGLCLKNLSPFEGLRVTF